MELRNIAVTTDLSPESEAALRPAVEFAVRFGAKLHIIHVIEDLGRLRVTLLPHLPPQEGGIDGYQGRVLAEARERLLSMVERLDLPGDWLECHVLEGVSPAEEVCSFAEENGIDLLVTATHGRSGLAHVLVGSVAERIVRQAPCPVLTVRAELG